MKILETKDGGITVIELDPSKWYWFVIDTDALSQEEIYRIRKKDGVIIVKRPGSKIQFIENADRIEEKINP